MRKIIFTFLALFMMSMNVWAQVTTTFLFSATGTTDEINAVKGKFNTTNFTGTDVESPTITDLDDNNYKAVFPGEVTGIGPKAFQECSSISSITVPSSVTSIGYSAFQDCSSLATVTFEAESKLESIGDQAFFSCKNLATVTLGANSKLASIGERAFQGTGLTAITIPASVASIGGNAFNGCSSLATVTFEAESKLESIGGNAFRSTGLTTITIPASVTSIGENAFQQTNLSSVTFTEGSKLTTMGIQAFYNNENLESVTIGSGVKSIGYAAFAECTSLTSIAIPASVTTIGMLAFAMCPSLETIEVADGNTTYDSRDDCNAIITKIDLGEGEDYVEKNTLIAGCKNTVIPNSVTSIGYGAFAECTSLTSLVIPNSVETIGMIAFNSCTGLTSLTIGNGVTIIGGGAFYGCEDLTTVTCLATTPPSLGENVFDGCTNLTAIYVPFTAVSTYKSDDARNNKGWIQEYQDLIAPLPFCITAEEDINGISYKGGENDVQKLEYSINGESTWTQLDRGSSVSLTTGNKMYVRAMNNQTSLASYEFVINGKASVSGDIRYLLNKNPESAVMGDKAFFGLFGGCGITSAKDLVIPETTPTYQCYFNMFKECKNLTEAPALPAMTMSQECCGSMFDGCISLEIAPELPATTLAEKCYFEMFNGCTSLTTAPELPATTLATGCYAYMFQDCKSLENAPALPATELVDMCYIDMFQGCTSLTTAPVLPATTLVYGCYAYMFYGCSNLNYVKCLATDISAEACTQDWLSGVAGNGTFVRDINTSWPTNSASGIPTGWTPEDARFPSVTLNGAGYATYSSAADINISTTGVKAYKASTDGTTITLTELNGYIPAGTGVLLYKESGAGTKVTFQEGTGDAADVSGNDLLPTTTTTKDVVDKPIGEQIWALGNGNKFLKYTGASFIANRAYLIHGTLSAKEMIIDFEGETTGINTVENSQCIIHNSQLYNLQGVRVNNNYKGIVIVNGKKIICR